MYKTDIPENGTNYQRISIPGNMVSNDAGEPELPIVRKLIAIPECDNVSLTANVTSQNTYSNYLIYPSPDLYEVNNADGSSYPAESFTINNATYSQTNAIPGVNAEIASIGYLRGQKYAEVFLHPVQFNPNAQSITVNESYNITLTFTNPSSNINENVGIFNNVASSGFINYTPTGISAMVNDRADTPGTVQWIDLTSTGQADNIVADYLILCASPFFEPNNPNSEVLRIANHRANYNGFDVAIVNAYKVYNDLNFTYSNYNYKNSQKIRSFLKRVYEGENAQNTYDGKLGYVLLIGDVNYPNEGMPTSYEFYVDPYMDEVASDYTLSCVTEENGVYDRIGDLYIGRFAVENNLTSGFTELHNIVEKTINFETEYSFESWRDEISHIYGKLNPNSTFEESFYQSHQDLVLGWMSNLNHSMREINSWEDGNYTDAEVIADINLGSYYTSYIGHGGKKVWTGNTSQSVNTVTRDELTAGLSNSEFTPFVGAYACKSAWFDKNNGDDCLGERLTTYSEDKGFVAYLGGTRSYWVAAGGTTLVKDMRFNIPQAIFDHMSYITGEFILEAKMGNFSSGNAKGIFNLLGDPALNIMAPGVEINQTTFLNEDVTISTEVTLKSGVNLSLGYGNTMFFDQNGILNLEDNSQLTLQTNTTVQGLNSSNMISSKGTITTVATTNFTAPDNHFWKGIVLDNPPHNVNLDHINFHNCGVYGDAGAYELNIEDCAFDVGKITVSGQDIVVDNVTLDNNSRARFVSGSKTAILEITNSSFINCIDNPLYIEGYTSFLVDNCEIKNNGDQGIMIYNSGNSPLIANNTISECEIENNGADNLSAGIEIYSSNIEIRDNNIISGNYNGITSLNSSQVKITGNPSATYVSETQNITDNAKNQIYATFNSFPYEIKWNAIFKENNLYPFIHYAFSFGGSTTLDVTDNYWGTSFDPTTDLFPNYLYVYNPIWTLLPGKNSDEIEQLYYFAKQKVAEENYVLAKESFKDIIATYPTSSYSFASMHDLLNIEENAGNNYVELQNYFLDNEAIQSIDDLKKLGMHLANQCDIKMGNFENAIFYYEDIILNPESLADSIFAIIDLGYTYFLMGDVNKNVGTLSEFVPKSKEDFYIHRDYLISLLFSKNFTGIENLDLNSNEDGVEKVSQNFPNPARSSTNIEYRLEPLGTASLDFYDITGRLINSIDLSNQSRLGLNDITINLDGFDSGMYFYKLIVDGKIQDSKEMIVIK